jgi:peptide/nickel transport system substrate-binding protein
MRILSKIGTALVVVCLGTSIVSAKTLRMAEPTDIAGMDPHSMTESNTIGFLHSIYEPLVRYNDRLQIEPALAVSWEVVEPTRWRFHLRKEVKFHNGSPFTADDVVASIMRAIDSPLKVDLPGIKIAEKVDNLTVDLVLNKTDPILLNYLTGVYILDKEWMEKHGALTSADVRKGKENYAVTNSNGTGPFLLESRQPEAKTVLVVNPNWWDTPKHNLTRIEFSPVASDATRVAALLSGELDFISPAPLQDVDRINRVDGVSVITGPELRTIMLGFNYGDKLHKSNISDRNPLTDVRVRHALNESINMDLIAKKVMRGMSRNAGILVAPPVPGYDADLDVRPPFNLDGAKKLLAEAGYPDGFEVGFDCPNDRYVNDEEICQAITSMWARLGVKAQLNTQTKSKYFEMVLAGGADIYMVGWATLPMLDTYSVLSALLHTPTGRLGGWNPGGYSNTKLDKLTDAVAGELDQPKRTAMMTQALGIAKNDVAMISLHQQPIVWAVRDGVKLKVAADNKPRLWYVTIAD